MPDSACPHDSPQLPMQSQSRRRRLPKLLLALLFFSPLLGVAVVWRSAPAQRSSRPLGAKPGLPEPVFALKRSAKQQAGSSVELRYRVVLKGQPSARLRAQSDGSVASMGGRDLRSLNALAGELGARFRPLIRLNKQVIQGLERRADERSGKLRSDLLGMLVVELPALPLEQLEQAAGRLQAHDSVELAYIQNLGVEPPEDLAPATPDYSGLQGYRGPEPGMDADFASQRGFRGLGVRVSDVEYGWNVGHEDLLDVDLHPEPGQTQEPSVALLGYDEHGTAVAGLIAGPHNGYGIDGLAADCEFHTYSEWTVEGGFRRVEAITAAAAASRAGDVVLLEMQTVGPGGGYGPAEVDPMVWAAVRVASDAGVIVVAAAGNGSEDLDSPAYASYRSRGDSGAILVGAGSTDSAHYRMGFSSFGQRVNLQGWGHSVFSSGYGVFAELGGDKNQRYTSVFSGTSSAAALVAGALAVVQSAWLLGGQAPLDSAGMLQLLSSTGAAQGSGAPIGLGLLYTSPSQRD